MRSSHARGVKSITLSGSEGIRGTRLRFKRAMPRCAPAAQQLNRKPCLQVFRQPILFPGTIYVSKSSSRESTFSQHRRVASFASPLDGPPGEAFIEARPGEGVWNDATSNSGLSQGEQGSGRDSLVDAAKAVASWGQIHPQQPEEAPRPRPLDVGAVTKWSERIMDTEEALESLEKSAKRKKGRGKGALVSSSEGAVVPEWQSLRDGLVSRAQRDDRVDTDELGSLSAEMSEEDEFDEDFDEEDGLSDEDEQQAQPAVEPRSDFTTMNEVFALPRILSC